MQSVSCWRWLFVVAAVGCSSKDVSLGGDAPTPTPSPTVEPKPKPEPQPGPTPSPDPTPTPSPDPTPPSPGPIDPPKPVAPCEAQGATCIAPAEPCAGVINNVAGYECDGNDWCCVAPPAPCEARHDECLAPSEHCSGRVITRAGYECNDGKVCCEIGVGNPGPHTGGASGMDPSLSGAGGE